MRKALCLLVVLAAVSIEARDRIASPRPAALRFAPAAVGDGPIWPMGGIQVRAALAIAESGGRISVPELATKPVSTLPWAAQWRIVWQSRDDIPALMGNPAWHAADPRYSAGAYTVRVWLRRWHPPETHPNSGYLGYWCEASTLQIPAALGTNQAHSLAIPSSVRLDDVIEVEDRLGLVHWIEVNLTPGGPWYRVSGGQLGETGVGIPSPAGAFQIGEPSYARCE